MSSTIAMFNNFKKLGLGFLTGAPKVDLINEEKTKIDNEVNEYLKNKMPEVVLIYMESGYKLSAEQEKNLFANLEALTPYQTIEMFNRVLKKGISISDDILAFSFSYLASHLKKDEGYRHINPNGLASNLILDKLNDETFTKKVIDFWIKKSHFVLTCSNSDFKYKICNTSNESFTQTHVIAPIEHFGSLIFKNKKLEDLSLVMEKIKELSEKYKKARSKLVWADSNNIKDNMDETLQALKKLMVIIPSYSTSHCDNEIADKRKKIGLLYDSGELAKLVAAENIKLSEGNDIKNLPSSAKNHLEQIKRDYLSLNKKLDDLTEEERFNINNLWNKRIPEIINKYLRADPEFRTTMKDVNGKTIEDLLNDSLGNIHEVLKQIQQSHTETTLMEMSALNRYAKALR